MKDTVTPELDDRYEWTDALGGADASYMASLPYTISIPKYGVCVVHAGIVPGYPLDSNDPLDFVCIRDIVVIDEESEPLCKYQHTYQYKHKYQSVRNWKKHNKNANKNDKVLMPILKSTESAETVDKKESFAWGTLYKG